MNQETYPLLVFAILGVWAIVVVRIFAKSRRMIEDWADREGYRIISAKYRWLRRGPFFWGTSKQQTVYRIRVVDSKGVTRSGWARCGSFWRGVAKHKVDVRWDDGGR